MTYSVESSCSLFYLEVNLFSLVLVPGGELDQRFNSACALFPYIDDKMMSM